MGCFVSKMGKEEIEKEGQIFKTRKHDSGGAPAAVAGPPVFDKSFREPANGVPEATEVWEIRVLSAGHSEVLLEGSSEVSNSE
ncbi:hypothetical protein R1sor_006105 [Riccia sorocarpa]|uniref:Uncharacterized protein n=1 Tax=Riccia sorocarpa TaxID=122646 RepID=A0ABD3HPT4_9MARC